MESLSFNNFATQQDILNAFQECVNSLQCLINQTAHGKNTFRLDLMMETVEACKFKLLKDCEIDREELRTKDLSKFSPVEAPKTYQAKKGLGK